jgi:type IV pilus assembly protein PilQ
MTYFKRLSVRSMPVATLAAVAFLFAGPGRAQEATTAPAGGGDKAQPNNWKKEVTITRPGTIDRAHFRDTDLRGVLRLLSIQTEKNIIATKEVTGKVTADFYNVTYREALDAIMRSTGFVCEEQDNFIYIYTPKQYEAILQSRRKMATQVYRLAYVRGEDVKGLVTPLLSKVGSISLTPAAEKGIESSDSDAGGNNYATDDVLIVHDYEDVIEKVTKLIADIDVKPQQVLIEATMLRATLTEGNDLGIDITSLASGITMPNMDTQITYNTQLTSAVPSGGLTMNITTGRVDFLIRALESITDVNVMANPKLLVLNKQRGEIMIGNRDGYLTTTVTETVATQTVQFLETGTRLLVRPYIGKDGFIRMEIHPEDSSGTVEQVGDAVLPNETTTEVTTNVIVRDGHTIIIGGLFRETTTLGRAQIPLLGNLPYVGGLFRRTSDDVTREEVIILITPHIIKHTPDEGVSEQLKDDARRLRLGIRKGLQWFGRSRLAQTHMRWAKEEMRRGDRAKALWNVDCALALQPTMMEAIRLKERLTGKPFWTCFAKPSEVQYVIEKMIMQDLGLPVERIVPPKKPLDTSRIPEDVKEALGIQPRITDPLPLPLESLAPLPGQTTPEIELKPLEGDQDAGEAPTTAPSTEDAAEGEDGDG